MVCRSVQHAQCQSRDLDLGARGQDGLLLFGKGVLLHIRAVVGRIDGVPEVQKIIRNMY